MPELISGGITLMVMGMSTVFVFLALLVMATRLMSWLINLLPEQANSTPSLKAPSQSQDLAEVVAVAAAVTEIHSR